MSGLGGLLSPPTWLRVWLRVAVVLGLCISGWAALRGPHITDCGFDSYGAYAEVRSGNLLGQQEVWVDFYLDGRPFTYGGRYDVRGTTVIPGTFPRKDDHHIISGRTVYVIRTSAHPFTVKFVTRKFAEAHRALTQTEVVPDASHTLTCRFDYTDPD